MRKRAIVFLLGVAVFFSFPRVSAAQWAQTGGRVFISRNGGTTRVAAKPGSTIMGLSSLSVVGTDLYAGVWSRVLVSRDEGATWMELGSAIPSGFVHGVVSEGPNLFAWSGEQVGLQHRLVARSTDKGVAWKPIDSGLTSQGVIEVECLVVKEKTLFAGAMGGVFVTADSGASWKAVGSGLPRWVNCLLVSGQNLFAGTWGGGIYLSTNDGAGWTEINQGLPTEARVYCLATMGAKIYAGILEGGVYVTADNGASWTSASIGLPERISNLQLAVSGQQLFLGTYEEGVYLSINNGASWTPLNSGLPPQTHVLCIVASGTNLFAGTSNGGVWRLPLSDITTEKR